jgi:aminoglycoside 3-N-acetyltransferase
MFNRQQLKLVKSRIRGLQRKMRTSFVRTFLSYGPVELLDLLRRVGIESGDAVMLHSAFEPHHGFRSSVGQAIDVFLQAVGPEGHLLMPSMAYHSSTLDYLTQLKSFDVRRTPSAMGLVSEFFRRRPGVLRSINPSHPILVHGPRAAWFIEGHERCLYPCGPGTPFDKLLEVGGKVAFFNVPFGYFTFFHYLEHRLWPQLKFQLYHEPPFDVPVIGPRGEALTVKTQVYSRETLRRRRFAVLEARLRQRGLIRHARIGASHALLVEVRAAVVAVDQMAQQGEFFYDMTPAGAETV